MSKAILEKTRLSTFFDGITGLKLLRHGPNKSVFRGFEHLTRFPSNIACHGLSMKLTSQKKPEPRKNTSRSNPPRTMLPFESPSPENFRYPPWDGGYVYSRTHFPKEHLNSLLLQPYMISMNGLQKAFKAS